MSLSGRAAAAATSLSCATDTAATRGRKFRARALGLQISDQLGPVLILLRRAIAPHVGERPPLSLPTRLRPKSFVACGPADIEKSSCDFRRRERADRNLECCRPRQ